MENIVINEADVRKLLKELNPHKATGPDGISSIFLKEVSDEIWFDTIHAVITASIRSTSRLASCNSWPCLQIWEKW